MQRILHVTMLTTACTLIFAVLIVTGVPMNRDFTKHIPCSRIDECEDRLMDTYRMSLHLFNCDDYFDCIRNTTKHTQKTSENINKPTRYSLLCHCIFSTGSEILGNRWQTCSWAFESAKRDPVNDCKRYKHACYQRELGHSHVESLSLLPDICQVLLQCNGDLDAVLNQIAEFPADISSLCPTGTFCFLNTSHSDSRGSLCSSCSCDYDCGKHGGCCFKAIDYYSHQNNRYKCVKIDLDIGMYLLNMTVTCSDAPTPCEGELNPVTDSELRIIYKNKECARCNCIVDYQVWETRLLCPKSKKSYLELEALDSCQLVYIPPNDDYGLVLQHMCLNDQFSPKCSADYDDKRVARLCNSTFAPMILWEVHTLSVGLSQWPRRFQNPYCALCKDTIYTPQQQQERAHNNSRSIYNNLNPNITIEQDLNVIKAYRQAQHEWHSTSNCLQIKGRCIEVHCPDGMLRVGDTCKYFVKSIHRATVSIQIKLKPVAKRVKADLMKRYAINNLNTWIQTHCAFKYLAEGNKMYMVQEIQNGEKHVKEIITSSVGRMPINLPEFFPMLKSCFRRPWYLKVGNITVLFQAELDRYKTYELPIARTMDTPTGTPAAMPIEQLGHTSTQTDHASVSVIVDTSFPSLVPDLYVTKLAYCENIELSWLDVQVDNRQVLLMYSRKVIKDGEYRLISAEEGPTLRIRVCLLDYLPDSGGEQITSSSKAVLVGVSLCLLYWSTPMVGNIGQN